MEQTAFKNKFVLVKLLKQRNKEDYTIVKVRPGVVIVAVTEKNNILLVKQYREALKQETLELPAGLREKSDETIIQTAKRELLEETSYSAKEWVFLGKLSAIPNIIATRVAVVLALDAAKKKQQKLEENEKLACDEYSLKEIDELIRNGNLSDATSIAAIYKSRTYLKI